MKSARNFTRLFMVGEEGQLTESGLLGTVKEACLLGPMTAGEVAEPIIPQLTAH